jgi:DNA-binding transcriptional LysR family regulator
MRRQDMNLKRLQAFRAVYEAGSVTAAAQRLHMTQPAVSRLIGDLEKELGLQLFARQRQRLVCTEDGRSFFYEAERALAAVDQVVDIARDIRTLKGAHLRVVTMMMASFGILPAATKALLAMHPQARVSINIRDVHDMADWVATGPYDVGIAVLPFDDPRVECELLATVSCVLAVPKDHRLAQKRVVSLRNLAGERVLAPSLPNAHLPYGAALEAAGVPYEEGQIDGPSAFHACQFVAQGLGVALVDPFTFSAASRLDIVALPIRPAIRLSLGFFFPANRPRPTLVNSFVKATRLAVAAIGNA